MAAEAQARPRAAVAQRLQPPADELGRELVGLAVAVGVEYLRPHVSEEGVRHGPSGGLAPEGCDQARVVLRQVDAGDPGGPGGGLEYGVVAAGKMLALVR